MYYGNRGEKTFLCLSSSLSFRLVWVKKSNVIFISVCLLVLFGGTLDDSAHAASVSMVQPISFGTIIVASSNVTVEINAINAAAAPHIASGGLAQVSDGASGLVQVFSDTPGQSIILTYPDSILLTNGGSAMTLNGIASRSKQSAVSTSVGPINFNVGGLLHIDGGQASANYSGTMTVNVTINNP